MAALDAGRHRLTGLTDGPHSLRVRALDAQDRPEGVPAEERWTVDTHPPNVEIINSDDDGDDDRLSGSSSAGFWLRASEPGTALECRLDDEPWARCTGYAEFDEIRDGTRTFEARGRDLAGNVDPTPASYTWRVDDTPPRASIGGVEEGEVTGPDVRLSLGSTEAGSTFECRPNPGESLEPCTSPVELNGLPDGRHKLSVEAKDPAGNPSAELTRHWTVDRAPPDTTLSGGPTGVSTDEEPVFHFAASEDNSTLECRLDAGAWQRCVSGAPIRDLADGEHTFEVRARHAAGRVDPTPARRTWTLDTTAPQTSISGGPADPTSATAAAFTPIADEPATFECRLDGAAWSACPARYENLAPGEHVFEARARDRAGHLDLTPAVRRWTIDTTPPDTTIGEGPSGTTTSRSASFSFSSETGARFECRLDAGSWSSCSSPKRYDDLADDEHTFAVRALDRALNADPTPAERTWTVDTGAPETEITDAPESTTSSRQARFGFRSDSPALFDCRLDGSEWSACLSPKEYSDLPDGRHTFGVRARDALGNADGTPAEHVWTIDTQAPETAIDEGPTGTVASRDARFSFSSEAGATFECRLRRPGAPFGGWDGCRSPASLTNLADGDYIFETRARDSAENVDGTPASRAWKVGDTEPPSARAPARGVRVGDAAGTDTVPVRLSWSGSDDRTAARALRFDLEQRADSSSPWRSVLAGTSATSVVRSVLAGTHQFRVRARDEAGNLGPWTTGALLRLAVVQESSRSVLYSGSWTSSDRPSAFGGGVRSTAAASARATLRFRGGLVGVVMPVREGLGSAEVCVDGRNCAIVRLGQERAQSRRIVYVRDGLGPDAHTLTVARARGRVDLDGFVILR